MSIPARHRGWFLGLLAGLLAALGALLGASAVADRVGIMPEEGNAPVIVVLGARVLEGGVASDVLRARVMHAVELYRTGRAGLILFSGGVGDHPPSEASVAAEVAVEAGVPREACLLEEGSHSTAENARLSAVMLRDRQVSRAIVVTDPYHVLRARQYFRREGVDVVMEPALEAPRHLHGGERVRWTLREGVALLTHPWLWFP